MKLIQYPQERRDAALEEAILGLESTAWPSDAAASIRKGTGTSIGF